MERHDWDKRRLKFAPPSTLFDNLGKDEKNKKEENDAPAKPTDSTTETSRGKDDHQLSSSAEAAPVETPASVMEEDQPPAPQDKPHDDEDKAEEEEDTGYLENPLSDEVRAFIDVWMETEHEDDEDQEPKADTTDYQAVFKAESEKFNQYRHHHFEDSTWKLYSENDAAEKKDEEWFIPSPPVLDETDPEYLCAMCRQIDFGVLFTQRGVAGNNDPGSAVIEIKDAVKRVLGDSNCSFCTLVRQGFQSRHMTEELEAAKAVKDGAVRLTVLDDGPEYALRLEVMLAIDMFAEPTMRLVVQMMAPEMPSPPLPFQSVVVEQDVANMERLRGWLRACEEDHKHEEKASEEEATSWRFVDVEDNCIVSVETPCRYVCLSYVWGYQKGTQLTTATISTLERKGGLNDASIRLGQTLRDGIKVTKDIGIRYIWIDALCIIQDDTEDKARCISRMSEIYGNALLNITASTNTSPADGLPGVCETPRSQAQVVRRVQGNTLAAAFHHARLPYKDIENSTWNSRAWTFQERQLSQRAVYFTKSEMYFTCPHSFVCEDTVPSLPKDRKLAQFLDQSKFHTLKHDLMRFIWDDPTQKDFPNKEFHIFGLGSKAVTMSTDDKSIPTPIYRVVPVPTLDGRGDGILRTEGETLWSIYANAVSMYTRRKMSWQTDALNAFRGVSDRIAQGINTTFWNGLPEFNFDQALLWYPKETLVRRTYEGASPSWSWASWEGHTGYRNRGWHNAIKLPSVSVIRWFHLESPRDVIYDYLTNGEEHTPDEIADFAYYTARRPPRIVPIRVTPLYHLSRDDWEPHRDTARNEHYYTHSAYPNLRFSYPTTLPNQKIIDRVAPDGALFFKARTVPVHFVDIAQTPHNPKPRVDPFLQIDNKNTPSFHHRRLRPWEHIIYHQGYRAGFISLNVPLSSLGITASSSKYHIVPLSRDSLPSIAPPKAGWEAYWNFEPRAAQNMALDLEWGDEEDKLPVLGPHEEATKPSESGYWENGDPYWDMARFGMPTLLDVYNVLLLEKVGEEVKGIMEWRRVGLGKMNHFAFWHAQPVEEVVVLR